MTNLKEHGPKDLLKAYPSDLKIWDLENSEFKEITDEEALSYIKNKTANKLQLLIDGKLVLLTPDGKAANTRFDVSPEKAYTKKTGKVESSIKSMPGSHLIKIADKIYLANLVNRDKDLVAARNAYKREVNDAVNGVTGTFAYENGKGWRGSLRGLDANIPSYLYNKRPDKILNNLSMTKEANKGSGADDLNLRVKAYDRRIKELDAQIAATTNEQEKEELIKLRDSYEEEKSGLEARANHVGKIAIAKSKDTKAAIRNAISMMNLQSGITRKQQLLRGARKLEQRRTQALNAVNLIKNEGSFETRSLRQDLNVTLNDIRTLKKEIAALELYLEDTSDEDKEALEDAQAAYDDINQQLNDHQDFINKLERIRKGNKHES